MIKPKVKDTINLENAWLHFNMKDPDITTCEETKIVKEPSRNKR